MYVISSNFLICRRFNIIVIMVVIFVIAFIFI